MCQNLKKYYSCYPGYVFYLIIKNRNFYYIHFEITGYPWNLIGSQQGDFRPNCTPLSSIAIINQTHLGNVLHQNFVLKQGQSKKMVADGFMVDLKVIRCSYFSNPQLYTRRSYLLSSFFSFRLLVQKTKHKVLCKYNYIHTMTAYISSGQLTGHSMRFPSLRN